MTCNVEVQLLRTLCEDSAPSGMHGISVRTCRQAFPVCAPPLLARAAATTLQRLLLLPALRRGQHGELAEHIVAWHGSGGTSCPVRRALVPVLGGSMPVASGS